MRTLKGVCKRSYVDASNRGKDADKDCISFSNVLKTLNRVKDGKDMVSFMGKQVSKTKK